MPNSKLDKIELEPNSAIEVFSLSKADYDFLTSTVVPKARRNFFWVAVMFLALIPIMPYFPARMTGRTLIEKMSYESAIVLSCFLNSLMICLVYYFGIVQLMRDIDDGQKCRHRTRVERKSWKGDEKFELELESRPKNVREKIFLDKSEFYKWFKTDLIEIEYLKRTGRILIYRKVETT